MSYLNPTNWGKTEDIVLLMFLNLMYASVILSCFLLLALLIIVVVKLELQLTGLIAAILSGLIMSVAVSITGLTLSTLTIYDNYKKPHENKIVSTLFLVVLSVTEVAAFLFTGGLFILTANAEGIIKHVHLKITDIVVENIENINNSLSSTNGLLSQKIKYLFDSGIMEQIKNNHHYNNETLKLLISLNYVINIWSFSLFVAVNYLCIRLIVIYYRSYLAKSKITYV